MLCGSMRFILQIPNPARIKTRRITTFLILKQRQPRPMTHTPSHPQSSAPPQWLFTKSEFISQSSSIRHGLDPQTEKTNRSKGCQFIETVGHKLRLHQTTIATATMFLHRFYMRQPMSQFHHYVPFPPVYPEVNAW
jgi:Cyclin, N-terminal domain